MISNKPPKDCTPGSHKFAEENKKYCERRGFSVGTEVFRGTALRKIEIIYDDIWGGVRLDRAIGSFVSWNINDLKVV